MNKRTTKGTHKTKKMTAEQQQEINALQERRLRDAKRWAKKESLPAWLDDATYFLERMEDFPVDLDEGVESTRQALAEAKANPTDKAKLKELAEQLDSLGEEMRDNLPAEPVDAYSLAEGFERFSLA